MGDENKHTRRRLKTWHAIVGLVLFLLVLSHATGSYKLNKRLQALQAQGYPITIEELDRSYTIPDDTVNAADTYLAACEHFTEWDRADMNALRKAQSPARTESLNASDRQLIEQFLSDNQKTLALLHEAAPIEHCRYPIDFALPPDPDAPWLDTMRQCSRLLYLDVLIHCENQDAEKALASIRANLALAKSMNAPLLIHWITRMGLQSLAYKSIERVLNRLTLSDAQLQALSGRLKSPDIEKGFKPNLVAEQCIGLHTLQGSIHEIASRTEYGKGMFLMLVPWKVLGLCYRDTLGYIDLMQDSIETLDLPDPERLTAFVAVQDSVRNRGGMLIRMIWPSLARLLDINFWHLARARARQTAFAVERYRLAEGRLPSSLDVLVPTYLNAIPDDPFNAKPLKYHLRQPGYVIYSVGEDQTDEGGAEPGARDGQGRALPWDITFSVER